MGRRQYRCPVHGVFEDVWNPPEQDAINDVAKCRSEYTTLDANGALVRPRPGDDGYLMDCGKWSPAIDLSPDQLAAIAGDLE